jgi:hypothetical protein
LYDSVNSVACAKIGTRYYKGVTASITPTAWITGIFADEFGVEFE